MPLSFGDGSTKRTIKAVAFGDGSTKRTIKAVYIGVAGSVKRVFSALALTLTNNGGSASYNTQLNVWQGSTTATATATGGSGYSYAWTKVSGDGIIASGASSATVSVFYNAGVKPVSITLQCVLTASGGQTITKQVTATYS